MADSALRLVLAVVYGSVIGLERETSIRPDFALHVLVCMELH